MRTNLIQARNTKHLTQAELAKQLSISRRMYQHLESGTRTGNLTTWCRLEEILNVPISKLQQKYIA